MQDREPGKTGYHVSAVAHLPPLSAAMRRVAAVYRDRAAPGSLK